MLLSIEIGIAIFVILAGFGYLEIERRRFHQARQKAFDLIMPTKLTPHEQLMRKYDCEMSPDEVAELHKANWR